ADPRGGEEYNLHLSQARAESVVNYLAEQHQIERDRLKPVGKGISEPLNTARPDAPENRRVTIKTVVE
ncbi:MAG: OmpA/MotB domain protein, partial [Proteobacteria bacterium]|nr:OmpA/MotB domain protein [Pseudomonadota bacterium]